MKDFLEKNKIPVTIIVAAFIIAASIWLSRKPPSAASPAATEEIEQSPRQSSAPQQPLQPASININYTQAPDYVGKYVCVTGVVDHVFTSKTNTVFLNFCRDYKNCPFGAVIFKSNASKFLDPALFIGKTVQITGFITAYQGRPEIILESPTQIKIAQ